MQLLSLIDMQGPPSPSPNNVNDNSNTNTTANNNSSQHASDHPSPATPTAPEMPVLLGNDSDASGFNGLHHRQAHSDGSLRISMDDEAGFSGESFNISSGGFLEEMGSEDDLFSAFLDLQKLGRNEEGGGVAEDLMDQDGGGCGGGGGGAVVESEKRLKSCRRGSSSLEVLDDGNVAKKAIPPEKLAEIWAVDPKRVKRILANRQSAARSKERKARYVTELERRVHSLQSEATNLSAQLKIYQRDTTNLTTENAELKIRLQAMDQQAQLRDVLNEALKQEVERLKISTGEIKTPSDSCSLGAWRMPYSPVASPSTLQPVQYSQLNTSTNFQSLTFSPSASAPPSTLQTMSYSPAASPSPRQSSNLFPLPKTSVPVLAQLPQFHNSRSGLSSCHLRTVNPHPSPEHNESTSRLQGLETSNRGLNLVNQECPPVSASDSSSTTQLLTP